MIVQIGPSLLWNRLDSQERHSHDGQRYRHMQPKAVG